MSFTSSFPIWIPFISFSSLIAVAKTSNLCWIVVVRVGTLVLFLTLGEMLSVFHHWRCLLWVYHVKVKVTQSCPTLCESMDHTVHGILQARILEWVTHPFSRGSSQPRDWTRISCIAGGFFTNWTIREAHIWLVLCWDMFLQCLLSGEVFSFFFFKS